MKLRNKLFINFALLFFITLNIFGYILIQSIFSNIIEDTINNCFKEFSVIYSNVKIGEDMNNLFLTNKELISIKSNLYLNNIKNPSINIEFRDITKKLVYSSFDDSFDLPKSLFEFNNIKNANYMLYSNKNSHIIIINKIIEFNGNEFYFTYMNDVSNLYLTRNRNIFILVLLNIFIGILLSFTIYYLSKEITKPLNSLIKNINEIINGNYNKKLHYFSNIDELNIITSNFNIMSEEIDNKIKLLENKNLEKQHFIDNLTHEIRTPLTSIVGYSSLILNKNINDINLIYKSLENIHKDGKRIESLTTNLIKLITLDKDNLEILNISIFNILYDIKSTFDPKFTENNIHFIIEGEDFNINSDVYLLTTLLSNFIDNSIKAIINSPLKVITVIVDDYKVIIKDSGVGIDKKEMDRIFEPFYMVDKSRSSSLGGFGLGLSICLSIIQLLNIDFDIESELQRGTKIILSFKGESL
ncbi:MAG: sensor histidine kinase [Paraclostridium sp.]